MRQLSTNKKLLKLNYLLQNSKIRTFSNSHKKIKSFWNLEVISGDSLCSQKSRIGVEVSKDFSLFLSLIEKPINLLFSIDQFLFEFSKKTYQQKKTGEFFQQLKERKKLSLFYGNLTRKQISNLFTRVEKTKGYVFKNVFSLLETRLDVVLYRTGLTKTLAEARQLIKHKKIRVNENIVNVPSFLLNPGDIISLTPKTQQDLTSQLVNLLNSKKSQKHSKIAEDFSLKLKKTLNSLLDNSKHSFSHSFSLFSTEKKNKETKWISRTHNFRSKKLAKLFIQLLCVKIKSRSFWNTKKQGVFRNQMHSKNSYQSLVNSVQKSIVTLFKWKSFSKKKNLSSSFFDKKNTRGEKMSRSFFIAPVFDENSKQKKNQDFSVYANRGCLQKKPVFWSRNSLNGKEKTPNSVKNSSKSVYFTQQNSYYDLHKKNVKSLNNEKSLIGLYRKSFLVFLKQLENCHKFSNLVILNMEKSLLTKYLFKQNSGNKLVNWPEISKNLTFRLVRPLNIEISYNLLNIIYLYSPQRVNFPFSIDLDLIERSLR